MTEVTQERVEERAEASSVDFGQALGALLRTYLENARAAVEDLPGGPRGFQVMAVAAVSACSNQARMAESLGLDRTVMTYLVDDLEKAGLVTRRPDPADRRARQVLLTTKGTKAFEKAASRIEQVERSVLGGLSDDDAATFRSLLMKVVAAGPVDASATPCAGPVPTC
ncbi:MAG: MarR family transcriptional regulator [Marmoricola sp.]|nr:MarR family transcriptional regulator [Marmoricola sp.]